MAWDPLDLELGKGSFGSWRVRFNSMILCFQCFRMDKTDSVLFVLVLFFCFLFLFFRSVWRDGKRVTSKIFEEIEFEMSTVVFILIAFPIVNKKNQYVKLYFILIFFLRFSLKLKGCEVQQ